MDKAMGGRPWDVTCRASVREAVRHYRSVRWQMGSAARVALDADQRVFYAELLLLEVVDDVVIGVGSALFGSDLGIEVCMLDLEGLKMRLCVHSQLSRLAVQVGRGCLRRWDV